MKVPKPRRMSSGTYFIQLRLGGQSISVTRKTERECIRAAELLKAEHLSGKRKSAYAPKTLTQAIDEYIAARSNVLSPATIRGYRSTQKNRFQAYMNTRLDRLPDFQIIVNEEAEKVSTKTLTNAWAFICSVLRENGIKPKSVTMATPVPPDTAWLEPEQIPLFLKEIHGKPGEMAALLALHSLRRSEIMALDKKDVDVNSGLIHVRGAVVPDEHTRYVKKKENKNRSSARDVPVMIPRLTELVCEAPDGPLVREHPDIPRRQVKRACAAAGLQEVTLHGLRHSFASLAYHLGLSELETMELGGWSDMKTMRKIYTHLAEIDRKKSVNKMAIYYQTGKGLKTSKNHKC